MQGHLETITADLRRLTPDELAAFRYILDRVLVVGRASYSPWVAEQETRDMVKEGADEGGDLCVYAGFGAVLRHIKRQRLVEEFKAAACDHWNELVEQDVCTGCGENAFDSVAYDALPTDSYLSAQAHAIAAFDLSDESPTGEFSPVAVSNNSDGQVAIKPDLGDPRVTDYCVRCGESPESGSHLFGHDYVDPRISAASSSAPSSDSPALDGTGLPNGEEGAATINKLDEYCDDCGAPPFETHLGGCPWSTIVPAKSEVA